MVLEFFLGSSLSDLFVQIIFGGKCKSSLELEVSDYLTTSLGRQA